MKDLLPDAVQNCEFTVQNKLHLQTVCSGTDSPATIVSTSVPVSGTFGLMSGRLNARVSVKRKRTSRSLDSTSPTMSTCDCSATKSAPVPLIHLSSVSATRATAGRWVRRIDSQQRHCIARLGAFEV